MFGRKKIKPIFVGHPSERRPLSSADVESFLDATVNQKTGTPTIHDLVAMAEYMKSAHPVEARAALKYMKWLCRKANKSLNAGWEHPWD